MPWLLLLFFAIPLTEVYFLIQVGGIIGAWPTVFLVIFTAVLGAAMLRIQGFYTLQRVREQMARGQLPAMELFEGVVLLLAGALLLTPGFFTDAVGFLCLIPAARRWLIKVAMQRVTMTAWGPQAGTGAPSQSRQDAHPHSSRTLEGEYYRDKD